MPAHEVLFPDHWYHNQTLHVRCIVPQCDFITPSESVVTQWPQMHDHCTYTPGPEHKLLDKILGQTICAIDDCDHPAFTGNNHLSLREVFRHEKYEHGSTRMSTISSFVMLSREGRIRSGLGRQPVPDCEKLAFHRMLEKVRALPAEILDLLFEKSGFHSPDQKSLENLTKILTYDPRWEPDDDPPYWWPIRAEHFLWLSRQRDNDPPDPNWVRLWTRLREAYANGRI